MVREKISNFIKNNKDKINSIGLKIMIVAIVVFIATVVMLNNNKDNNNNSKVNLSTYIPTDTVIKGKDVSEKQYEKDSNLVNTFLMYCNNKEVEKAYDLLSDECKKNKYISIQDFEKIYYEPIFSEKKEYTLQSWISTNKYTIYKIKYINDILSTGKYEANSQYEDYITLLKENNEEKISIGSFIISEEINKTTSVEEINFKVTKRNIYLEYEEYEIKVSNNTDNTILLDTLSNSNMILLLGEDNSKFNATINSIFLQELTINSKTAKTIKVKFNKLCSSGRTSKYIQFSNVIKNYEEYQQDTNNYTGVFNAKIEL